MLISNLQSMPQDRLKKFTIKSDFLNWLWTDYNNFLQKEEQYINTYKGIIFSTGH